MNQNLEKAMIKAFEAMSKHSIEVSYMPLKDAEKKSLSKFGGKPNVPQGFEWPYYEGNSYDNVVANRPLSFMAEIHLSEVAGFDADGLLPDSGVLSFFYEMETEKWGFDPRDKGCARVFYFEKECILSEHEFPEELHQDYCFPELLLSFERKISLPSYGDFYGSPQEKEISEQFSEEMDACDWDEYDGLKEQCGCKTDEWGDSTRILGYPDVIQNPMEGECEAVTRGFYMGDACEMSNELEAEIQQASKEWMLLFQMGTVTHGEFELMFGDCGHIYFWIRKEDLAARNFDKVWLILQCS